jgi:N-glycosidase YbiA
MAIRFYSHRGPLGYLSNFYPSPITVDGATWPTTEHYFQGMKFEDAQQREVVRLAPTPTQAKRLGRQRGMRADWNDARVDIMREALAAKFEQHPALRAKLIATAPHDLIEAAPRDYYWGEGADGSGHNMLGLLLTELRSTLTA